MESSEGLVLNICSEDTSPIDIDELLEVEHCNSRGADKISAINADSEGEDTSVIATEGFRSGSVEEVNNSTEEISKIATLGIKKQPKATRNLAEILYDRGVAKVESQFKPKLLKNDNFDVPTIILSSPPERPLRKTEITLFSDDNFDQLKIHSHLVGCLRNRMQISTATTIQKLTIPILLQRKDVLIKSPTGSGKTLAYALPILHILMNENPKINRTDGTRVVIITPTRELALQTYNCLELLCKACQWIVPGILMGGEKKKSEKARLRKGITVMVVTPGRLIDHMGHTSCLSLKKSDWLVIDEADRMLEMGFEQSIFRIINEWKKQRSVECGLSNAVLLSATLTPGVEKLAGLSLTNPVTVDSSHIAVDCNDLVLPESLEQTFMVCPTKLFLVALTSMVIRGALQKDKVIVFLPTQGVVDFYLNIFSGVLAEAFAEADYKVNFYRLHGTMSQTDRTEVFRQFRDKNSGVLLTTDVASRGLDIPNVDLIIQFCLPLTVQDYVHRVGRTARIGTKGCAVLILMPCQSEYLKLLANVNIRPAQVQIRSVINYMKTIKDYIRRVNPSHSLQTAEDYSTALHLTYEAEVKKQPELLEMAHNAFTSYVRSAASYPKELREVAPFKSLHLGHVAKMFCLVDPPKVLGRKAPRHMRNENKVRYTTAKVATSVPKKRYFSEYDSGLVQSNKKKKNLM